MTKTNRVFRNRATNGNGFTLIEVMISIVILLVGLLMMLALFTKGLSATRYAHEGLIAKQKAHEQLEAIYAARNNGIPWANIDNSGIGTGVFLTGFRPLYRVLPQQTDDASVLGTDASYAASGANPDFFLIRDPASGNFSQVPLDANTYARQIEISNPSATLKTITVTVRVRVPGVGPQFYSVQGLLASGQ